MNIGELVTINSDELDLQAFRTKEGEIVISNCDGIEWAKLDYCGQTTEQIEQVLRAMESAHSLGEAWGRHCGVGEVQSKVSKALNLPTKYQMDALLKRIEKLEDAI